MNPTETNNSLHLPFQETELGDLVIDFSKMKKRKTKNKLLTATITADNAAIVETITESVSMPLYSYSMLLDRLFENISSKDKEKDKLHPNAAQVHNQNKITSVDNFDDIVKSIRVGNTDDLSDSKKHFANYLLSELSCGGYFSNSTLVLAGKFTAGRIDNICLKYIDIHIRCLNCRGFNTTLFKNTDIRKYAIECVCGSKRTLPIVAERTLENKKKK